MSGPGNHALDGRALFMSTLAPQVPNQPVDQIIPAEWIMYVQQGRHPLLPNARGINKWQLGRVADRAHFLGQPGRFGVAEIFAKILRYHWRTNWRNLIAAFDLARDALNSARDALAANPTGPLGSDLNAAVAAAHADFSNMTSDFNEETETTSGILSRIERSRLLRRAI